MPFVAEPPEPLRVVHVMGIGGTAMASLAGMLVERGIRVTGSDGRRVYPPMSDHLARLGIEPATGWRAENLDHDPDLVVVGNVVRAEYEEARELLRRDLPYTSMPALLSSMFLRDRRPIVVAGTHGKTTTTALLAWVLHRAGREPGWLVGGIPVGLDRPARAGRPPHFVVEGDEYDTAFFDKRPKFLHYRPHTAILTSVEFDHADIYRDEAHYREAFRRFVRIVPPDGCIVARWDHDAVAGIVGDPPCEVRRYGPGMDWDGRIEEVDTERGEMRFVVLREGRALSAFRSRLVGEHNLYNQVAAVAVLDREGLDVDAIAEGLASFRGVRRRQEVRGEVGGIVVVDDFAHHPTAVRLTLEALRLRFGGRRLWAIFEPRSNTSRRNVLQADYARAFDAADLVVVAPARDLERIPPPERMDVDALVDALRARGLEAWCWGRGPGGEVSPEAEGARIIAAQVVANAAPGDVLAVLSNGGFGGLHDRLLAGLRERFGEAGSDER